MLFIDVVTCYCLLGNKFLSSLSLSLSLSPYRCIKGLFCNMSERCDLKIKFSLILGALSMHNIVISLHILCQHSIHYSLYIYLNMCKSRQISLHYVHMRLYIVEKSNKYNFSLI